VALRRRQIEEIYRRRYLRFRNALATITGSYDSARDVVQEAFVQALRHRRSFRGDGPPEAWVWSIALRIALRERANGDLARLGAGDEIETALVEPDRDQALAEALQKLPPRRRLMIFLRYYADLSYEEIASLCGVSPGTVAATLAQSRDSLRASLTRQGASR
jgi:RNA polymerase sigma-70 factor, ECF subfamily